MTIRTFWTILLKILGIWLTISSLRVIPQFITAFSYFGGNPDDNILTAVIIMALLLVTLGIYILVIKLFVFNSKWIIDKLKLDQGFDNDSIDLNIKLKTVLTVAIIVIGGLLFIDSLPVLCKEIFDSFQQQAVFREDPNFGWIIFYFIKTLSGYLLMTNSKFVVEFIDKQKIPTDDK